MFTVDLYFSYFNPHWDWFFKQRDVMKLWFEKEKMNESDLDELTGKYCRVVSKVPESGEVFYDFGTLKNVGYEDDFVLVDTKSGLKRLRLDNVYDIMSI